jgi:enterochelin esterase family protein
MNAVLQRAKKEGTPLIDGEKVTFVWEGETAPLLKLESQDWQAIQLQEIEKGAWTYSTTLPTNAYMEYNFTTDPDDDKATLLDPLNKRSTMSGLGWDNNYFDMPDATHTSYVHSRRTVAKGKITRHNLDNSWMLAGGKRDVWLYQPPVDEPVPLLVVYDGKDYYRRAHLPRIVDNLIADDKIEPIALAMIHHAKQSRFIEYINGEAVLNYLWQLVLPLAHEHLKLIDISKNAGAYGVLGASMGGLMALHTGLRMPHIFGHVISQSGAFFGESLPDGFEGLADSMVKHFPKQNIHIWQDVGLYEWLLPDNRRMNGLLKDKGYDVTYREYAGGHNFTCWRDMLPDALITLYGK